MITSIPLSQSLSLSIPLYPSLSLSIPLSYLCYSGPSVVPGAIATVILVDSSAIAVAVAISVAVASLPLVLPHLYIDQSFCPSDETQKNDSYLLRIQATKAAQRKVTLQVAQDVTVLTVGGQRENYSAAKGIFETAQLVYPWIKRDQVYAKMKILKKRDREHEALEHGAPPATGGAQPENTVDMRGGCPKRTTAAATRLLPPLISKQHKER